MDDDHTKTKPCIDCGESIHPTAEVYERTSGNRRCFDCVLKQKNALEAALERLRREMPKYDCRHTGGAVADTGGVHCPPAVPCARCRAEKAEAEVERLKGESAEAFMETEKKKVVVEDLIATLYPQMDGQVAVAHGEPWKLHGKDWVMTAFEEKPFDFAEGQPQQTELRFILLRKP